MSISKEARENLGSLFGNLHSGVFDKMGSSFMSHGTSHENESENGNESEENNEDNK